MRLHDKAHKWDALRRLVPDMLAAGIQGCPFVCLEPWYGRTDDAGFAGTLAQKPGVQILDSGETQEISYEIEFHSECD